MLFHDNVNLPVKEAIYISKIPSVRGRALQSNPPLPPTHLTEDIVLSPAAGPSETGSLSLK